MVRAPPDGFRSCAVLVRMPWGVPGLIGALPTRHSCELVAALPALLGPVLGHCGSGLGHALKLSTLREFSNAWSQAVTALLSVLGWAADLPSA